MVHDTGIGSAALIISTSSVDDDEDLDRSLLYSTCSQSALVSKLKGLSLALRGVMDSICGQQTSLVKLKAYGEGQDLMLVYVHLQACMLMLVVPPYFAIPYCKALGTQTAQVIVTLAGPSYTWTLPTGSEKGQKAGASPFISPLRAEVKEVLDRVFRGVLTQLSGPCWTLLLPHLIFQGSLMHLPLVPHEQHVFFSVLSDFEEQMATAEPQPEQPPAFRFYTKRSCLFYRGSVVASRLGEVLTHRVWCTAWSLGLMGPAPSLPCRVVTHTMHLPAKENTKSTSASGVISDLENGATSGAMLMMAAACNIIMGVIVTALNSDHDMLETCRQEGLLCGEVLQEVHCELGDLLELAAARSVFTGFPGSSWEVNTPPTGNSGSNITATRTLSTPLPSATSLPQIHSKDLASGRRHSLLWSLLRNKVPQGELSGAPSLAASGMGLSDGFRAVALNSELNLSPRQQNECVIIVHDPSTRSLMTSGALPSSANMESMLLSLCGVVGTVRGGRRAAGGPSQFPSSAARVVLTLDQINQLAAPRTQLEAGQRLSSADVTPWMGHPEMYGGAATCGAALPCNLESWATQLISGGRHDLSAGLPLGWYVTAEVTEDGREIYICHNMETDEKSVIEECNI